MLEVEVEGGGPDSPGSPAGLHPRERGEENLTGRWPGSPAGAAATNISPPPPTPPRNTNTGGMESRSLNRPPGGNSRDIAVTSDREILQPGSGGRRDDGRDPVTALPPPPPPQTTCTARCVTGNSQRKLRETFVFREKLSSVLSAGL